MSDEYRNGFMQAVLCADSFWDNIDLYGGNPIIRRLDPLTIRELKGAMNNWTQRYLEKVTKSES